jgi:hypothetical protein
MLSSPSRSRSSSRKRKPGLSIALTMRSSGKIDFTEAGNSVPGDGAKSTRRRGFAYCSRHSRMGSGCVGIADFYSSIAFPKTICILAGANSSYTAFPCRIFAHSCSPRSQQTKRRFRFATTLHLRAQPVMRELRSRLPARALRKRVSSSVFYQARRSRHRIAAMQIDC